jgi:hypothetical protein
MGNARKERKTEGPGPEEKEGRRKDKLRQRKIKLA